MNFLQYLKDITKMSIAVFVFVTCCVVVAFSQETTNPQDQGRRYGDPNFRGEVINLRVVNSDIRDILNYITEQYGVNFVIDKSVQKTPITINVSNVPWNIALDSILRSQDLRVQNNGGILRIVDKKALDSEVEEASKSRTVQIDNSPLYTEFIRLNYARAAGTIPNAGFNAGNASGGAPSSGGSGGGSGFGGGQQNEGVLPIIKRRLSSRGSVEIDNRSNTVVITDVRENIDAIRQLVLLLDQPEPQVEIEARIVIASRNFSRDVGFQLSALVLGNGVGNGGGINIGTLPNSSAGTGTGAGGATTTNGVLTTQPNNNLGSAIGNTVVGLTTGLIGTARINALLTAGEQNGQAKTIATPRVTALNNRSAVIENTQKVPVITTQPGLTGGGGAVFTTTYVDVPLKLEVTPQITDAGTVLLNVSVENSNISSTVSVGGTPGINTQRMKNEVMVPDGGTTVVGGALIDVEGEDIFRTPGVSRIPVIGNLFKRKAVSRQTQEILFFITPRIYRPDYNGNPTNGTVTNSTRTTTILQPVPLGNPPSNSQDPGAATPPTTPQPITIPSVTPVVPVVPTVVPTPRP